MTRLLLVHWSWLARHFCDATRFPTTAPASEQALADRAYDGIVAAVQGAREAFGATRTVIVTEGSGDSWRGAIREGHRPWTENRPPIVAALDGVLGTLIVAGAVATDPPEYGPGAVVMCGEPVSIEGLRAEGLDVIASIAQAYIRDEALHSPARERGKSKWALRILTGEPVLAALVDDARGIDIARLVDGERWQVITQVDLAKCVSGTNGRPWRAIAVAQRLIADQEALREIDGIDITTASTLLRLYGSAQGCVLAAHAFVEGSATKRKIDGVRGERLRAWGQQGALEAVLIAAPARNVDVSALMGSKIEDMGLPDRPEDRPEGGERVPSAARGRESAEPRAADARRGEARVTPKPPDENERCPSTPRRLPLTDREARRLLPRPKPGDDAAQASETMFDAETLPRFTVADDGSPTCCPFHASGGHPEDRHGRDPASVVYRQQAPAETEQIARVWSDKHGMDAEEATWNASRPYVALGATLRALDDHPKETTTMTEQAAEPAVEAQHESTEDVAARVADWATPPAVGPAPATAPPDTMGVDPSSAVWAMSLQPRDASEAFRMAKAFHASGLYRKKFTSPEAIWTVMLLGREHGLSALASLQSLTIIEGKVEMDAALLVAKILRSGAARYFSLVETTETKATWATHRAGAEEHRIEMTFTIEMARKRGLVRQGSNWEKMPDVMCMWRAATKLGRAIYPDVVRGLYGQGEIREALSGEMDDLAARAIEQRDGATAKGAQGAR